MHVRLDLRQKKTIEKLNKWEKKILRNIYEPVYRSYLGIYEKRQNNYLYYLYGKPNMLTYIRFK